MFYAHLFSDDSLPMISQMPPDEIGQFLMEIIFHKSFRKTLLFLNDDKKFLAESVSKHNLDLLPDPLVQQTLF